MRPGLPLALEAASTAPSRHASTDVHGMYDSIKSSMPVEPDALLVEGVAVLVDPLGQVAGLLARLEPSARLRVTVTRVCLMAARPRARRRSL